MKDKGPIPLLGIEPLTCACVVALSEPIPNLAAAPGEVDEPDTASDRYAEPQGGRQRVTVTKQLTAEIVKNYRQGLSSQEVAEVLGIAKSTVLRVLKLANVPVRPWGVRYRG